MKVNGRSVNPYPGATLHIPRNENNNTLHFDLTLPQDAYGIANFTYDAVTGTVVAGTTSSMERLWNANTSNLPTSFTYTGNTSPADFTPKPAGLYKLLFKIEGGNIPVETGSVEWSDLIYVEPGRSVAGTINIPQLFTQPNAPGAFSRTTKLPPLLEGEPLPQL